MWMVDAGMRARDVERAVSYWRNTARSIISTAIAELPAPTNGDEFAALRRLVGKSYPWGERKMHPYKMWCMEMAIAFDRLYVEAFGRLDVHTAYRVRCPACGAGAGVPCRPMGALQDEFMVAQDAELEGRLEDALRIRRSAFHDARLAKVGMGSAAIETLPLFGGVP